ncbi:ribonucleotide-diphosphate reductase subunit beta [bacterium]|nr:ribonucleotide-diphosphate reductase subunit beta [bacterium]
MKVRVKNIINKKNVDTTKQPMFFGEGLNLQRYDKFKYKKLFDLFQQQLSFFWRPEEVDLSGKEKNDFNSLTDHEKFIFTKNLSYQILLDSVQGRGISHLLEDCSNPEFEAFAKSWEFFETIHSYSYTYIIKNVYANPSDVFDEILNDKEVLKRTASVTKYYDDLINSVGEKDVNSKKKKLYLTLVSINILEGIRFYVSFACSYAMAQNKKMEGNAKIISLINRDENLHLALTQNVLKYLRDNEDEGFQHIIKECEGTVIEMFKDAAQEEMEWAGYLFKDGSILGLNEKILVQYMKYLTNKRMKVLGLPPAFEDIPNPINWIQNWTESKRVQVAPQESEIESYKIGSFSQNMNDVDVDEFDF